MESHSWTVFATIGQDQPLESIRNQYEAVVLAIINRYKSYMKHQFHGFTSKMSTLHHLYDGL